ncbi:hypothetical protein GCM10009555_073200 [Acrocarpospora macrocephala]|uniref:Uncharacterized protein n=2 Tax=Acrocarpospora macrocephala TaxID=150177 RepID=A0A5M3WP55_9ACTN|nr:hypothetical protein Amac_021290 [Acrocarpospora macrocephala]
MIRKLIVIAMLGAGLSAIPSWAAADAVRSHTQYPCPPDKCPVVCPLGHVCVPSPKQCITTPCPQFECALLLRGTHEGMTPLLAVPRAAEPA